MDRLEIIGELRSIIEEYLKSQNIDLVDLIYRYEGSNLVLRILADFPSGGINLKDCAYLNKEIDRILDEKDILQQNYLLEVSSPGLDRPLTTKGDFLRCLNKEVRIFFREPFNGKLELEGVISKVEDDLVMINVNGNTVNIPIRTISRAKQIV